MAGRPTSGKKVIAKMARPGTMVLAEALAPDARARL